MSQISSKDGTKIGFEKHGSGPAVILVDGALGYRGFSQGAALSGLLAPHFTVYTYDRRGRGESSNSKPFALEREVEDLAALIQAAGGEAYVYGISSGACLVLEAATRLGKAMGKIALYEPPYNSDPAALQPWKEYRKTLDQLVASGKRGEAVELFMHFVGTPEDMISGMQQSPAWGVLESVANTLPYDAAAMGEDRKPPLTRAASIHVPALIMDGEKNLVYLPFMHQSALALAKAIPGAQQRTLAGQDHNVSAEALAPVLIEFFCQ